MKPVSLESTATVSTGGILHPFRITQKLSYLTNDSADYDMKVNFDGTTGESGTFTVKAGETINDIIMDCETISVEGVGGSVAFRVLGV